MNSQDYELIQTDDAKLACKKMGQGPNLVFIHGRPLNSLTYRHLAEQLKKTSEGG